MTLPTHASILTGLYPFHHGARDNASGIAALLEVAEAYAALSPRPRRSVVFLATTAEEQGLLGSAHYAENPLFPLNKTVAAVNMDVINTFGRTTDIVVVGYGNSELDGFLAAAAQTQDRVLVPDPDVEKGFFYRSDHFPLSKKGVPAIYADPGTNCTDLRVSRIIEGVGHWVQQEQPAQTTALILEFLEQHLEQRLEHLTG